ncbi:MAG: hypothetical protein K0U66_03180 [Gammaproteobacteria bacterium]|nr:hypothetical protein [Gammaproteobacteria bacterium]
MPTNSPQSPTDVFPWWATLKHGGLLIAPAKLADHFGADLPPLSRYATDLLRRDVTRVLADEGTPKQQRDRLTALLDTVLETVLGLDANDWLKGPNVGREWSQMALTRETIKPRRVWIGPHEAVLPLFVDEHVTRLGVGRGRRSVSRVVEWLRKANCKIGLLTNGRQWRLIHAGADYDAWCEWDAAFWFEEGLPSRQVDALRHLLNPVSLTSPEADTPSPLLAAIQASRQGQAELSAVLGERVRQAVELLIKESSASIRQISESQADGAGEIFSHQELYIAACRTLMRCVIVLFAEARDLLPRDNAIYHGSYGIQGLREQLDRLAGGRADERLRHAYSAWPRLLALFQLVYGGSAHQALTIPAYRGGLFAPGDLASHDPVQRAMVAFESVEHGPSDAAVYRMLQLLTRSQVKVRQGRGSTWVDAPVDFSDLSSEYIGILYQGLLDFELRQAAVDEPIIFLNLGDQPALPLTRLEQMDEASLNSLVEKLKKSSAADLGGADEDDDASNEDIHDEEIDDVEEADDIAEMPDNDSGEDAEASADEDAHNGNAHNHDADYDAADYDARQQVRMQAIDWAIRAVKAGGLVNKPRGKGAEAQARYEEAVKHQANQLIARIVLPDEWFLVRWGGTRKGSGTFYTRPQLGVPLVRRTLEPLVYQDVAEQNGVVQDDTARDDLGHEELERDASGPNGALAKKKQLVPRKPEAILALKVCDSAMGSGSLLAAALRYLTDGLLASLYYHGRIAAHGHGTLCRLADGQESNSLLEETLPVPPDHDEFEDRLRARLKRYVIERCIYGVDIDPLAVDLAKLALWIETMDRSLPFGFLDHKLKCGNALVGCWFDRFQDYPVMAWAREGGDKNHDRFVHHYREFVATRGKQKGQTVCKGDKWTQAIKDIRNDVIKPQMVQWITAQHAILFAFMDQGYSAPQLHDEAFAVLEQIHELPVHASQEKAQLYQDQIVNNPEIQKLRQALDTWCAIWFWPGGQLDLAPTPRTFERPDPATVDVAQKLVERYRFFHWELEYPDVFTNQRGGFDALIGNPPWDIAKPKSQEFFSNIDPLFRTYGKQEANAKQVEYFTAGATIEEQWLDYSANFKALSNWTKHVAFPFGDDKDGVSPNPDDGNNVKTGERFSFSRSSRETESLHGTWRRKRDSRSGFADREHPFRHQGSADINTYKMFLELNHALARKKGRLGMIVPSGLYTDKGTIALRELFLNHCRWEWLFGYINWNKIFESVYYRFKFCLNIVEKGGTTEAIQSVFSRYHIEEWEEAERYIVPYQRKQVERFSPRTKAILETRTQRDLDILTKIYANSVTLGDDGPDGWDVQYRAEFHMTNDSKLFPPRPAWEKKGYRPDEYGHWLKGGWQDYHANEPVLDRPVGLILSRDGTQCIHVEDIDDIALPLYEGRMIGQFDFSQKGWVSGRGRSADWREIPRTNKVVESQYLMSYRTFCARNSGIYPLKTVFMDVTSSTNARAMIATSLKAWPGGHKTPRLVPLDYSVQSVLSATATLNSFTFDFLIRSRLGGQSLTWAVLDETALASNVLKNERILSPLSAQLTLISSAFADIWRQLRSSFPTNRIWKSLWAVTIAEHIRQKCMIDAVIAELYEFSIDNYAWVLHSCDHPTSKMRDKAFYRTLDPKGFWRVDKAKDPELRHAVLSLIAFHDLKEKGLDAFLAQNDGEGWMIPDTIRLADYGLGHDERAQEHQPVASRLGPRFLPWQLEGTPEESWAECERHAENLRLLLGDSGNKEAGENVDELEDERPVQLSLL